MYVQGRKVRTSNVLVHQLSKRRPFLSKRCKLRSWRNLFPCNQLVNRRKVSPLPSLLRKQNQVSWKYYPQPYLRETWIVIILFSGKIKLNLSTRIYAFSLISVDINFRENFLENKYIDNKFNLLSLKQRIVNTLFKEKKVYSLDPLKINPKLFIKSQCNSFIKPEKLFALLLSMLLDYETKSIFPTPNNLNLIHV